MNAIADAKDPNRFILSSLMKQYVKKPAKNNFKRIVISNACPKKECGIIYTITFSGKNTALIELAAKGVPRAMYGFQRGIFPDK